ncbi:SEP-domain-containing protein [Tuber magnatum]|uniref:SEP-domain-containing protein n=1 Tax=Tuber magnatum TaxID=42249 RepID=A0A317SVQ8_9PEZI|nr:SEP-domain-containing protein [Tuber magnatum]
MSDQDSLIQNFCAVTGSDAQQARHLLEASNWNIESATEQFFEANDEDATGPFHHHLDSDSDGSEALYDPPRQAPGRAAASSSKSKFATLGDLKGKDGEEDDGSDDEKQDLFAGGEKSGLAVQNPGDPRNAVQIVQDILKRGAEGPPRSQEEEAGPSRPRFTGTGRTLGSDDTESVEIPDPDAARRRTQIPTVTRSLTFWSNGFSVEDGPLMHYDDPANQDVLRAIQSGRAPLSLMNVEPGQPTDVKIFSHTDEVYDPTKKKPAPFSGAGQRLGSPTPGASSSPIAAPPVSASAAPPVSASTPTPTVNIDDSVPHTTLQVRLSDGTRLRSRFNHNHTVGDLYGFVNGANLESRTRAYRLQTTFPINELRDMEQTIKDANLINAVVVQKWA